MNTFEKTILANALFSDQQLVLKGLETVIDCFDEKQRQNFLRILLGCSEKSKVGKTYRRVKPRKDEVNRFVVISDNLIDGRVALQYEHLHSCYCNVQGSNAVDIQRQITELLLDHEQMRDFCQTFPGNDRVAFYTGVGTNTTITESYDSLEREFSEIV